MLLDMCATGGRLWNDQLIEQNMITNGGLRNDADSIPIQRLYWNEKDK